MAQNSNATSDLESQWRVKVRQLEAEQEVKISAMRAQHECEKADMMKAHHENLTKALDDADHKWRKVSVIPLVQISHHFS